MRRALTLALAWVCCWPEAAASSLFDQGELYFETVGGSEESVSGAVTALAQDASGFVWIGTQHGVVRYDGYRFRLFSHDTGDPSSIGGNFVLSIWPAADGRIWVGTRSSGLSIFDPRSEGWERHRHDPEDPGSLANDRVSAIVGDPERGVWVATNEGLDRWDPDAGSFTHHRHVDGDGATLNDDHVRALWLDRQGDLWVGTWQGLNRRRRGNEVFESVFSDPAVPGSLADHVVFDLLGASDGALWIATPRRGAIRLDPATGEKLRLSPESEKPLRIPHPWVTALAQPSAGTVWMGMNGGGVAVVDALTGEVLHSLRSHPTMAHGIGHDDIGSMLVDASGLVWIGTWGAGLHRHNPATSALRVLRAVPGRGESLSAPHVLSLLELTDGRVWVGTQGNGIDVFDPEHGRVGGFRADRGNPMGLSEPAVHALAQTSDGTVWVGTHQTGLYRYRPATEDFVRYGTEEGLINVQIRRLLAGHDGDLWIGTFAGLSRWVQERGEIESFLLDGEDGEPFTATVLSLALEAGGRLWIGTDSGLYFLLPGRKVVEPVPRDPGAQGSLSADQINGLLLDHEGRLVVTTPQGIDRLTLWRGGHPVFESVNELLGVRSRDLGSNLLEDGSSRIWTATHLVGTEPWRLRRWTVADGVDFGTPWDGAHCLLSDGTFAFGGTEGVLLVRPEAFSEESFEPPVVVTDLLVDGERRLAPGGPVVLAPESRSLSVEFAALDYSLPQANRYAYRLDGYDPEWIEVGSENRRATYTNLDPGHYSLEIKGSNRLGDWSPHQVSLAVQKLPAFYQTLFFRGLVGLTVLFLLSLGYRLRVRQLKASERRLQSKVEEQTRELSAKNDELTQALDAVLEASLTDPLTGLRNRRFLQEALGSDMALVLRRYRSGRLRSGSDLIFFLIDIDRFKAVNDTHGHAAGDAFLVAFAEVLRVCFRDSDLLVRWGGEEFLAVSRFVDRAEGPRIAERLRRAVEEHVFELGKGVEVRKTCSIGFAAYPFDPREPAGTTWEEVVNLADLALYAAKRSSRNAWIGIGTSGALTQKERARLADEPRSMAEHPNVTIRTSLGDPARVVW